MSMLTWPGAMSPAIAPDQSLALGRSTTTPAHHQEIAERLPVTATRTWDELPHPTISAGEEIGNIPMVFSTPKPLRRIYNPLRGGLRRTLIQSELQSDITATDRVMKPKGMTQPYVLAEPGPWYQSFERTIR